MDVLQRYTKRRQNCFFKEGVNTAYTTICRCPKAWRQVYKRRVPCVCIQTAKSPLGPFVDFPSLAGLVAGTGRRQLSLQKQLGSTLCS